MQETEITEDELDEAWERKRSERCATCGKPRGVSSLRDDWSLHTTVTVPRTGDSNDAPWQQINDLIVHAGIYRNGGTDETTHLCDACLTIGLTYLKNCVDKLLSSDDASAVSTAKLTERLGTLQAAYNRLAHDHDRMQSRLCEVIDICGAELAQETDDPDTAQIVEHCRWEVERGRAESIGRI